MALPLFLVLHWLAGAIASEAYSQPFEAQCAVGTVVWKEAASRNISVEELATNTSFLSGYRFGGWHRQMYDNPPDNFITIASYVVAGECTDYGAKHFDGKYWLNTGNSDILSDAAFSKVCPMNPVWDKHKVVKLVKEIQDTCLYE
jgi:hypothetical protein